MAFYGDLVTGAWDPAATSVDWEIVDGAPTMPVSGDPNGWRGGVSAPGDDVGLWTSVAEAGETIHVAYHDRTNGALKLASGGPGAWNVQVVDDTGFAGRYASLLTDGGNLITDGPFAETKEQLGGFYLINADDLDEAIAWVAKMPHLPRGGSVESGGSVEIRPIMEFGETG